MIEWRGSGGRYGDGVEWGSYVIIRIQEWRVVYLEQQRCALAHPGDGHLCLSSRGGGVAVVVVVVVVW